jgi:hypothetical protein
LFVLNVFVWPVIDLALDVCLTTTSAANFAAGPITVDVEHLFVVCCEALAR